MEFGAKHDINRIKGMCDGLDHPEKMHEDTRRDLVHLGTSVGYYVGEDGKGASLQGALGFAVDENGKGTSLFDAMLALPSSIGEAHRKNVIVARVKFDLIEARATHNTEDDLRMFAGTSTFSLSPVVDNLSILWKRVDLINSEFGMCGVSTIF